MKELRSKYGWQLNVQFNIYNKPTGVTISNVCVGRAFSVWNVGWRKPEGGEVVTSDIVATPWYWRPLLSAAFTIIWVASILMRNIVIRKVNEIMEESVADGK